MTTKEQITSAFILYNDDANSRWEDEKILELCDYKEDGDTTHLKVAIGKYDTTFHDLVVDAEGIAIKQQSDNNPLIEDVIHYILTPIFFGSQPTQSVNQPNQKAGYTTMKTIVNRTNNVNYTTTKTAEEANNTISLFASLVNLSKFALCSGPERQDAITKIEYAIREYHCTDKQREVLNKIIELLSI